MTEHKFQPGDRVKLQSLSSKNPAEAFLNLVVPIGQKRFISDVWEVTRLLPLDTNEVQYHVRSMRDGLQRRVYESQLAPMQ
jgi:hypothetical protein